MSLDLYVDPASARCRCVLMLIKQLGIEVNIKNVSLLKEEQLKPEFIELNPTHTVPTISDDGFVLWESRAVLCYLANKYAKDDTLYPTDPQKRAMVDRILYFDDSSLYPKGSDYLWPQIAMKQPADPEKEKLLRQMLGYLEGYLDKTKYVAADHLTIADFTVLATVSSFEAIEYDISDFPKVKSWLEQLKTELPYYNELNQAGVDILHQMFLDGRKSE